MILKSLNGASAALGGLINIRRRGLAVAAGLSLLCLSFLANPAFGSEPSSPSFPSSAGGAVKSFVFGNRESNYEDLTDREFFGECPPDRAQARPGGGVTRDRTERGQSAGLWAARGLTRVYFGRERDVAIPKDYTGDGTAELAVFRTANGLWAVKGVTRAYFGSDRDTAIPEDYNGDGSADIAVFRRSSGLWAVKGVTRAYFGSSSDIPVPIRFNPSSACRIGIFRPASGLWAIKEFTRTYFGTTGDIPVPGDYDGDGKMELGIYRESIGLWAVRGVTRTYFGSDRDVAVPGDYTGAGLAKIAVFRPGTGRWAVREVTRCYFGRPDDLAVPADYDGDGTVEVAVARGLRSNYDDKFVFAILGDTHISPDSATLNDLTRGVVDVIATFQPEITFHVGDTVGWGCSTESWDIFMEIISPLHRDDDDFYISIGNHDSDCWQDWLNRFNYPGDYGFYSIRHKQVCFMVLRVAYLNNTSEYGPGGPLGQYEWLVQELEKASNDPDIRFIIVFLHVPLYGSTKDKGNIEGDPILTPLFDHYNVDVVFTGHHHNYQRSIPIRSALNPEGTVYVVTSGGGNYLRAPIPRWYTEVARQEHHAVKASSYGDRVEFEVININGQIIDSFTLNSRK